MHEVHPKTLLIWTAPLMPQARATWRVSSFGGPKRLEPLVEKVWTYCESASTRGRTVTLKLKFFDFEMIARSRSVPAPVSSRDDLERLVVDPLRVEMPLSKPIRLLGVSLSSLQAEAGDELQLVLAI
jgi:DNA polymerase-4